MFSQAPYIKLHLKAVTYNYLYGIGKFVGVNKIKSNLYKETLFQ